MATTTLAMMPVCGLGQTNTGGLGSQVPQEDVRTRNNLPQAELKRIAELVDQWNRVEEKTGVSPRVARARAQQMLKVLNVSCKLTDSTYRGMGSADAKQHVYESACADGMGYLITVQGESLSATSCLVVGLDGTQGNCALPANMDRAANAAAVLRHQSIDCAVREVKWLGANAANLDHVEVACENGGGYILQAPRPGSAGKLHVLDCTEAASHGIACGSTPVAGAAAKATSDSRPPLSWFKEVLTRNGVACETKTARIVGRESVKRRYVVEFKCPARPEGLIAFVPPEGDTANSFEFMSCAAAASRGIRCELLWTEQPERTN